MNICTKLENPFRDLKKWQCQRTTSLQIVIIFKTIVYISVIVSVRFSKVIYTQGSEIKVDGKIVMILNATEIKLAIFFANLPAWLIDWLIEMFISATKNYNKLQEKDSQFRKEKVEGMNRRKVYYHWRKRHHKLIPG